MSDPDLCDRLLITPAITEGAIFLSDDRRIAHDAVSFLTCSDPTTRLPR